MLQVIMDIGQQLAALGEGLRCRFSYRIIFLAQAAAHRFPKGVTGGLDVPLVDLALGAVPRSLDRLRLSAVNSKDTVGDAALAENFKEAFRLGARVGEVGAPRGAMMQ